MDLLPGLSLPKLQGWSDPLAFATQVTSNFRLRKPTASQKQEVLLQMQTPWFRLWLVFWEDCPTAALLLFLMPGELFAL